jgi:hypothetical protein
VVIYAVESNHRTKEYHTMNATTTNTDDVKLLVDRQVLQRAAKQGDQVGRLQVTKCMGRYFEISFWYNEGKLVRLTDREMTAAGVQTAYGCA